jgi:signal transduction histidine kinase
LLENANKYSPPDEPITVSVEMSRNFVITSVTDRGNGIDTHEQHLIFDELYRGKNQRHLVPGTGMGLPIAKTIVEAHGGSLSVISERRRGSVFYFTLPIDSQFIPTRNMYFRWSARIAIISGLDRVRCWRLWSACSCAI